ncbi:hypothetical protein HHX47_DHR12000005 [Lentinula edodes]|nr:hypothetical protein HHX47_DHR12000005 [Lentinula edodes]
MQDLARLSMIALVISVSGGARDVSKGETAIDYLCRGHTSQNIYKGYSVAAVVYGYLDAFEI